MVEKETEAIIEPVDEKEIESSNVVSMKKTQSQQPEDSHRSLL